MKGRFFTGGLEAVQNHFDARLIRVFHECNAGEFQGIWLNRRKRTQFDDKDLAIYFQRTAHITGRVVGEEVQHALDFAMGAGKKRVYTAALAEVTEEESVDWWHRRVFTRLLQNIEADQFGLGILRSYTDEIFWAYQNVAGRLTLEDTLLRQFKSLF